jgi:uncharacterized protein
MFVSRIYSLAFVVLSALSLRAEGQAPGPAKLKTEGYLSDFAHVVDTPSRNAIVQYCGQFERATGVQIALVTISTLGGDAIEDWSAKLFHNWGVGQKGSSEGVMLVLVINDKKSRIEVGYGLEQYLPDGLVGGILRQMRPQLQVQNYGGALLIGAQQMAAAIAKGKGIELADRPQQVPSYTGGRRGYKPSLPIPFPLLLFGFVALAWGVSRLAQRLSGRSGSGRGYRGGGGPGIFWGGGGGFGGFGGGGGGGGGGSSSGGFGGFGGGDSGGGGASSDW